jgi:hypothetical protein
LVLLYNTQRDKDITRLNKFIFKWLGSYRVTRANLNRGLYVLAEVDGAELGGTVAGSRLKYFYLRPKGFSIITAEDDGAE